MKKTFLLIADIGGYTRFMKVHRINLAHAQYIVAQLLEAVIDGAANLKLAKLEGDAAFFYAEVADDSKMEKYAQRVADIRRSFLRRQNELVTSRLCNCDGCMQAGELKLKFVAHAGEVAFQKVKRHTELAGVDVIFVHRLLKNSVPVPEYVLMSDVVHEIIDPSMKEHSKEIEHDLEGFGTSKQFWIDLVDITKDVPESVPAGPLAKFFAWLKMTWRSIPYFIGAKNSCEGFRNAEGLGVLPPPIETTPSIVPPSLDRQLDEP